MAKINLEIIESNESNQSLNPFSKIGFEISESSSSHFVDFVQYRFETSERRQHPILSIIMATPVVTRDPRFLAGRKLVERGLADEAVDVYATLLEETRLQYGDASIETAPAYYEYGNTLLRAVTKQQMADETINDVEKAADQRTAAAAAAEKRLQGSGDIVKEEPIKEEPVEATAVKEEPTEAAATAIEGKPGTDGQFKKEEENDNDDDGDDVGLALEMMENSYSIFDVYKESIAIGGDSKYVEWVKEQTPRVLMGIGDTLSKLIRHADAADAYSRALELRKACLQEFVDKKDLTTQHLKAHRTVCEANVLIAEELLACPEDQDVVTTETQSLIVKAGERVEYARGYYDQARDALQEAVVFMGSMPRSIDLAREKEDVCFLATLVMGVGEALAAIDEKAEEAAAAASTEPVKKKFKTG